MKGFMKLVFYAGFLFFGGGFLIAFGQFVIYNGLGNIFEYVQANDANIEYETTLSNEREITKIYYSYKVNDKLFESTHSIFTSLIEERDIRIDKIYYNKRFPSFNYVGSNQFSLRKTKVSMIVMSAFFIFLFLLYKFADMDKWIGLYTGTYDKSSKKKREL